MKKLLTILGIVLFSIPSHGKDKCLQCEKDSLRTLLKMAANDEQKLNLLKQLLDVKLIYGFNDDDTLKKELKQYVALGALKKIKNIEAYKIWDEAYDADRKRDFKTSLEKYKKAIDLFDQEKEKIPCLIAHMRNVFTNLYQQDEKLKFYTQKVKDYQVNGPAENLAAAYHGLANYYNFNAEYGLAISYYLRAGDLFKHISQGIYLNELTNAAQFYLTWGNSEKGNVYAKEAIRLRKLTEDSPWLVRVYYYLGDEEFNQHHYDKAIAYYDSSFKLIKNLGDRTGIIIKIHKAIALVKKGEPEKAIHLIKESDHEVDSLKISISNAAGSFEVDYAYYCYHQSKRNIGSAEKSLLLAYKKSMEAKANTLQLKYLNELAKFYAEQRQFEKAYSYNSNFIAQTKSLDSANSQLKISPYEIERNDLQQLDSINVLKQRQAVQAATIKQDNIMLWISLAALLIISVSLSFVYRQYRTNKKTLESLRKTQQQLVLAEKMASLGELTAGIAHEIQNPLNFINNFSEVNKELLTEMDEEIQKGNFEGVKLLAKDVISNQEKINHHGKRADAIVKSMLQHSRKSTGQKELIDVNEMCEEYLRLAYHGLRAKDKSFNAKFETNLDPTAGKVNIIAQDVGRVILNLINNAFYAVNEKKNSNSVSNYEPEVTIGTKKINSDVVITVRDNGTGIKQEVIDKIFQPFFTTKPTGLGTGLGLSLSYDIVKAHGGEIKVESIVGEGTTFTIKLPS